MVSFLLGDLYGRFQDKIQNIAKSPQINLHGKSFLIYSAPHFGAVAQLVRASACHAEGREFEPRQLRQNCLLTQYEMISLPRESSYCLWGLSSVG